jgi:hypothetical protein
MKHVITVVLYKLFLILQFGIVEGREFFKSKGKLLFHWCIGDVYFTHNYIIMIFHKHNYIVGLRLDSVDVEDSGCVGCMSGRDLLVLQVEGNMSLQCWDSVTLSVYQPGRSEYSFSRDEA